MAAIEDINGYFASMSGLASKVASDVELIRQICFENGEWEGLTSEEKEQMIDRYMIDDATVQRYASGQTATDEYPDCFPVLRIHSGEKIVVDFEHEDGWTFTDEHSAPFSWKTNSQQDLTFADLDDIMNPRDDPMKKSSRFAKRPRSPDRSVWETPFTNGNNKNEIEQMFEKFGIKMTDDEEEDEEAKRTKEVENLSSEIISRAENLTASRYDNRSFLFDSDDVPDSVHASPSRSLLLPAASEPKESPVAPARSSTHRKHRGGDKKDSKKHSSHRHGKDKEKRRREKDVASSSPVPSSTRLSAAPISGDIFFGTVNLDQLSASRLRSAAEEEENDEQTPDFEQDFYNRSRDDDTTISQHTPSEIPTSAMTFSDIPSVHGSCRSKIIFSDAPVGESSTDDFVDRFDDSIGETGPLELSTSELLPASPITADDSGVSSTVKTGFDFLDNW